MVDDEYPPWDGDNSITGLVIEEGVTRIGEWVFYKQNGLRSVTIPRSVKSIEEGAFYGCTGLTSINVNKDNTAYVSVDGVLFNKTKDTLILYPIAKQGGAYTIPNGVKSIGESAFSGCIGLTSITIPNSMAHIGEKAFTGCIGLRSITLPGSVKSIGESTFRGCTGLESITISSGLRSIGEGAFLDCTGLISINVNKDNPVYGSIDGVLFNKTKDTLILYPKNKRGAYIIPNTVKTIEKMAFDSCAALTSVMIPNGVTKIDYMTFRFCKNLTSITIPNSVTKIEESAFAHCTKLTSVTIPQSVTIIVDRAFNDCPNLISVTSLNPIPPILDGDRVFDRIYDGSNLQPTTLYVPASALNAYKRANGWGVFNKIRPVEN
jgi:hypothetical protein